MQQCDGLMGGGGAQPSTAAVQGDMLSDGRNGINMPLMEQNSVFAVFPRLNGRGWWPGTAAVLRSTRHRATDQRTRGCCCRRGEPGWRRKYFL